MVKKARIIEDLGEAYGPLTSTLTPAYQARSTLPTAAAPTAAAPTAAAPTGSTETPATGELTSVIVPAGSTPAAAALTTSAATTAPTVNKAPADIRAAVGDTKQKGITPFLGAAGAIGANTLLTSILGGNKDMPSLLDKAKAAINNDIVGPAKEKLTSILDSVTKPATTPTTTPTTAPATKPAATTTPAPKTGTTPAAPKDPLTSAIVGGLTKGLTSGTTGTKPAAPATKPGEEEETGEEEEVAEEEADEQVAVDDGVVVDDEQVAADDGVVVDDLEEDVAFKDDDLNEDIYVAEEEGDGDTVAVNDTLDDFDESGMDDVSMPGTANALDGGEAAAVNDSESSAEQLQQLLSTPEGEDILRQVMVNSALESDASLADDPDFEAKIDEAMDQLRNMSTEDISSAIRGESPLQQVANESSDAIQEAAENSLSNLVGEQPEQAPAETSPLTQVAQEQETAPAPEQVAAETSPLTQVAQEPTPAPEQQQPSPLTQVAQEQPAPAPAPEQQAPLTQVAQQQPQTPVEQAMQQAQETMNSSPLTQAMDNLSNAAAEPEVDYDKLFEDYMNSINAPDTSIPDFAMPDTSVPDFTMPELEMPDYEMPELTMPDFSLPDFSMPDFSLPDYNFEDFSTPLPDYGLPDYSYDMGGYDSYDPGSYDYGGYDNSYDYDYKRGGRVMRKAKGGLSSIRHFEDGGYTDTSEDGGYTDTSEEVQDWQNVDSGTDTQTIDYTNTDEEVQDWQNVTDNLNVDHLDPEDVGGGVIAYRDGDGNVVKVIGADGKNVTDQYITPTGQLKPGTGLRGSAQSTSTGKQNQDNPAATSFLTDIQNLLTNPAVKTGITGALLAELLSGQDDKSNKGVNVGSYAGFAPRTTPFGMGPARQVSLGAANALPQQQNTQLMASLGVPGYGFKPPTPTPYTEPVQFQYPGTAPAPEPKPANIMARGGLAHMADGGMAAGGDPNADPQGMPGAAGQTGGTHYTFGMAVDPLQVLGVRKASGGLTSVSEAKADVPLVQGRKDYRQGAYVTGAGDGQSDDIPAMLADGEYVIDAELVSMLGNGSNKAGAKVLDKFRQQIREHKRSAPLNKIPPKAKSPLAYLKGVK